MPELHQAWTYATQKELALSSSSLRDPQSVLNVKSSVCYIEKQIVVAIDGPAGAGKSTIARRVAERFGFLYVDSGAMYRAVALAALQSSVVVSDVIRIEQLAATAQIEFKLNSHQVILNGQEVSQPIREPIISEMVARISQFEGVRNALVAIQRKMAATQSIVMDGRDIGSVVFPKAEIKIFLDADPGERSKRRMVELLQTGHQTSLELVADELRRRDAMDRSRNIAPLCQAPDAQLVDTTRLTIDEVEAVIFERIEMFLINAYEN
jgi:cytidylate kinase